MALDLATAVVKVRMETDRSTFARAQTDARNTARSMAQEATRMFAQFFSAKIVVDQINGAIQAAAGLEQAIGGTQATFKEASVIVDDFARNSADSAGLSEAAFRTLTSQIGGLLNGFGFTREEAAKTSVQIAQLGADLAATFGGQPEEAVQALGAALRGEFDPLERFGVSLNQTQINLKAVELGLATSTGNVDQNARAQAALALIMERSVDAQGQFAREADTASGKQARLTAEYENARAKLGEQLLPIYAQAVEIASKLVDVFSSLPGPVQGGLVAMLGIAAVAGPVRDVTKAFGGLTTIVGKLGSAAGPLGAIVAVAGIAAVAMDRFRGGNEELERRSREVGEALVQQADATFRVAFESEGAEGAVVGLAAANRALSDALIEVGADGDKVERSLGQLGLQGDRAAEILIGLGRDPVATLEGLAREAEVAEEYVSILAKAVNETNDNGNDLARDLQSELFAALEISWEAAGELADKLMPAASAMEELQDQSEKTDLDKAASIFLNTAAASSEASDQLIRQAEANVRLRDGLENASRAGEGSIDIYYEYVRLLSEADQATQDAVIGTDQLTAATDGVTGAVGGFVKVLPEAADKTTNLSLLLDRGAKAAIRFGLDAQQASKDAKQLGEGVDDAGEAAANAAGSIDQLVDVTSDLTSELDDAESAYNDLVNAINRVLDPGDKLRAAARDVLTQFEQLTEAIDENGVALNEQGTDVAINTDEGRAMQEQLEATRDAILEHGAAMIGNGRSARDAAADIAHNTAELRNQLLAAGLTTEQVDALLRTYGLMPDQVTTYISVAGEQEAKRKLDEHKTLISQLPTSSQLYIQALIDRGAWNLVNSQLNLLTAPRSALIQSTSGGGNRNTGPRPGLARGGVVDEPFFGWVGEDDTEVVLPKNRGRIAEILGDPRAAEIAGMARDVLGGGDSSSSTYSPSLQVSIGSIGSARDVPEALDAVDGWWWEFSQTKAHS